MIENQDKKRYINDNEVKNISHCILLHDIKNPPKRAKNINSRSSPILHGCMNTGNDRANFKNLQIILDGGFFSTIVTKKIV